MAYQRSNTAPPMHTNSRHVTISSDNQMDHDNRSFQHNQPTYNTSLKITVSNEGRPQNRQAEKSTGQNQRQGVKKEQQNEQQRPKEQQPSGMNSMDRIDSYDVLFCSSSRRQKQ